MNSRSKLLTGSAVLVVVLSVVAFLALRSSDPAPRQPAADRRADTSTGSAAPSPEKRAPTPTSAPTDGEFRSLAVGAGGFVTGISFSDDGSTRVVRTDGFGGYRWSKDDDEWQLNVSSEALPTEAIDPATGGGVLAVAVAPSDGSRVYMAFDDAVFRSDDGARSWVRVLQDVSTEANDDFRTWGSRLAVDPRDPDVVFYGTQLDGLYRSADAGRSWQQTPPSQLPTGLLVDIADEQERGDVGRPTTSLEDGSQLGGAGVSSLAFGPTESGDRTQVVYAASFGEGVYRSADAGESWEKISPELLTAAAYMRVLSDGDLILTSHSDPLDLKGASDVWRLSDGSWTQVQMPLEENWRGVAVDPVVGGRVVVMAPGGRLALSEDNGVSWRVLSRTQSSVGDVPWLSWALNEGTNYMSLGEVAFDPVVAGRLWFTEGTGVWFADLGAELGAGGEVVRWRSQSRGIEQLVPTGVSVPPGGRPVLTAWDRPIFRSEDPEQYPARYGPVNEFSSAWSADWSVEDPEYLVASVASHQWPSDPSESGFSVDGGRSWESFPSIPENSTNAVTEFGFGTMAVGGRGNVVWVPAFGKRPQFTVDGGESWEPLVLPGVEDYSVIFNKPYYVNRQVVAADKAVAGTFYLYVLGVGTFRSVDGGRSWELRSDNSSLRNADFGWAVSLKAVPGREGELFMTPGKLAGTTSQPFKRSTDGGASWSTVEGLTGVTAFGFGKAFPGREHPAVFAAGYLEGRYGVYRSVDGGERWEFLVDYPTGRTPSITAIDGDKDVVGRVYTASTGGGWAYGGSQQVP